jgi:hypothetical protein
MSCDIIGKGTTFFRNNSQKQERTYHNNKIFATVSQRLSIKKGQLYAVLFRVCAVRLLCYQVAAKNFISHLLAVLWRRPNCSRSLNRNCRGFAVA